MSPAGRSRSRGVPFTVRAMPGRTTHVPLLPRAVELARGGDLVGALAELRERRTFDLQAAYAQATRRRHEGGGNAAALELLETALLARRRKLLRPLRWYEHGVIWMLVNLLFPVWFVALYSHLYGWRVALWMLAAWAVVGFLGWRLSLRWRRQGTVVTPAVGSAERSELARTSDVEQALGPLLDRDVVTAGELVVTARRAAAGIGAPIVALAALRTAEGQYSFSLVPAHRRRRRLLGEARQEAATQLDAELRACLR